MRVSIAITFLLLWISKPSAQVIYLLNENNQIERLNVKTCEADLVTQVNYNLTDITFHPDGTLYGIDWIGLIVEIDTILGDVIPVATLAGEGFNSLTAAADGIIYASGHGGEIWSYNKSTGQVILHGSMDFDASGDLTFYKGELYAAVSFDRIAKINIDKPEDSFIVIDDNIDGDVYGIVSYAENCDSLRVYAISYEDSKLYLIDFIDKSFTLVCDIASPIYGGASTYEFLGSTEPITVQVIKENPSCSINNGIITILAEGGTPPLMYSIDGINFKTFSKFTNLPPGFYNIVVQDVNGCTFSIPDTLINETGLAFTDVLGFPTTCGLHNGSIEVETTGGEGIVTYSVDGSPFQTEPFFNNLGPGVHNITAKDASGCKIFTSIPVLQLPDAAIDSVKVIQPQCNEAVGLIDVAVNSPFGTQFSLDGGPLQNDGLFTNVLPGTHTVVMLDDIGCWDTVVVEILTPVPLILEEIQVIDATCTKNSGSILVFSQGGTGTVQYSINNNPPQLSPEFNALPPGTYTVSVFDESGCLLSGDVQLSGIGIINVDVLDIEKAHCQESDGTATIMVSGANTQINFSIDGNIPGTTNTFFDLSAGEHTIQITDETGCLIDTSFILLQEYCNVYVPNTFSPNNDGINDYFQLSSPDAGIIVLKYLIFDRWGNNVYSAEGFSIASQNFWWDGTFRRITMTPGVFAYFIEVQHPDGLKQNFKGNVTIVR